MCLYFTKFYFRQKYIWHSRVVILPLALPVHPNFSRSHVALVVLWTMQHVRKIDGFSFLQLLPVLLLIIHAWAARYNLLLFVNRFIIKIPENAILCKKRKYSIVYLYTLKSPDKLLNDLPLPYFCQPSSKDTSTPSLRKHNTFKNLYVKLKKNLKLCNCVYI